jgi:hypothetical protein
MPAVHRETTHGTRPRKPQDPRRPNTAAALVRALNDPGRGALLDALVEVRLRLARDAPEGWAGGTLAALADGLLERLADAGIRPLRTPGEVLSLTAKQLAGRFDYHGSPFRAGERRKRVVVAAPGWAVGRRTIVRPAVREAPAEKA